MRDMKGITLIALAITIIVLLILAGVTIAMLMGENGILRQMQSAKSENGRASVIEEVQIETAGSFDDVGNYNVDKAIANLKGNLNIQDEQITNKNGVLIVDYKGYKLYIDIKGKVTQYYDYIKNGLILRYDGIMNTRNGNNPNSIVWEDLSGNKNDGNFVNTKNTISYKEEGYEFGYNSDYVETTNKLGLSSNPNVTFEFIYKLNIIHNHGGLFIYGSNGSNGRSLCHMNRDGNINFATWNRYVSKSELPVVDKKSSISFVKKAGSFSMDNVSIYENGNKCNIREYGTNVDMNIVDTKMQIGRSAQWNNENRTINGIIYAVRVYNRALTDDEIKENYELDKYRFGI